MTENAYAVILAGGRGERFWPMSTADRPKQLLALTSEQPMLAESVRRLQPLIDPQRILIITGAGLAQACRAMLPEIPPENIVGEPCGRDTAPALATAAAIVRAREPRAAMAVLTADHAIGDLPVFQRTLREALQIAAANDLLITIGIPPHMPSTGFGYLEAGETYPADGETPFFRVRRFVEKPDSATARRYLDAGNYYWNSGMFVWSLDSFEKAAARHHPELGAIMQAVAPVVGKPGFDAALADIYARIAKISIDYAVMEKSENIIMARARFSWDDLGSWSAMRKHLPKDRNDNTVMGRVYTLDATGNVIVAGNSPVALIGVSDLVVVQHNNAVLVCRRDRDQDVKKIVEQLKQDPACAEWL